VFPQHENDRLFNSLSLVYSILFSNFACFEFIPVFPFIRDYVSVLRLKRPDCPLLVVSFTPHTHKQKKRHDTRARGGAKTQTLFSISLNGKSCGRLRNTTQQHNNKEATKTKKEWGSLVVQREKKEAKAVLVASFLASGSCFLFFFS